MEAIDEYLNGRPAVRSYSVTCIAVAAAGSVVHIVPGLPVNPFIVAASSCFMSRDPESGDSARVTPVPHFLLPHPVSTCHRVPSLILLHPSPPPVGAGEGRGGGQRAAGPQRIPTGYPLGALPRSEREGAEPSFTVLAAGSTWRERFMNAGSSSPVSPSPGPSSSKGKGGSFARPLPRLAGMRVSSGLTNNSVRGRPSNVPRSGRNAGHSVEFRYFLSNEFLNWVPGASSMREAGRHAIR